MRVPLSPPPGLISDDTTFATEGGYEDGSNVRFWMGKPQTIGGWQAVFEESVGGVCRNLLPWRDLAGQLNIAIGTHLTLEVYVAGQLVDITPDGLIAGSIDNSGSSPGYGSGSYGMGTYSTPASVYYMRTWSLDAWGANLLAAPRGGTIYQWANDPGAAAEPVSNAPANITVMLVTSYRQVLALGCNEAISGDFNPLCIRGCAIEDVDDWTPSPDNTAFQTILEGGGSIVGARLLGDDVIIWTDNALYWGRYIGAPDQIWRFDRVEGNCGLIGPNAAYVTNRAAYWIAPDRHPRFWLPGGTPQLLPCPIGADFAENLHPSQQGKIVASGISSFDEVWFHYPDVRDGNENSRYIAVSAGAGAWFRGLLARTAACDAGVASYPLAASADGSLYYHENGRDAAGAPLDWFVKTADQYLGEGENWLQVQGIWPDFEAQQGDINLTVSVRAYPQAEAVVKGPFPLIEGSRKKDFRVSGRIASITFSGSSAPAFMRVGKPTFDAIETGER